MSRRAMHGSAPSVAKQGLPASGGGAVSAAPEKLLPSGSIVERTILEARRTVALALGGAALIVLGLLVERGWLFNAQEAAADRHAQAQRLAGDLRLADQRLNDQAQLAVASGQQLWIDRYDAERPALQALVAEARALAAPADAERFRLRADEASEALSEMRLAAFEAVSVGQLEIARTIFEADRYREQTAALTDATLALTQAVVADSRAEVDTLRRRNDVIGTVVLVGALLLAVSVWLRLTRRLEGSRGLLRAAEDRVQKLATSDHLTGLANRVALHDAMGTALARAAAEGRSLAVLMIDLDRFKPINDRHGHMVGDLVLKEVARRLTVGLRAHDVQARYGGDEFVVVVEEDGSVPDLGTLVAQRLVQAISLPIEAAGYTVQLGASVGIARYPGDASSADELLRRADSALYRAKAQGRGVVRAYDGKLDEQVSERARLELAMRDGIPRGEFVPYYQPIVDLASGSVYALEMLCRWQHPERGLVMPNDFIPLAEETGLVGPMMFALLERACQDLHGFPPTWQLSVNLAPQQLQDPTLVPHLLEVLQRHDIDPRRIDIELTETALVADTFEARRVMQAMKDVGITVSLDDFGTGYSSLSYLAEMHFDKVKIDRSFVRTLHERPESAKIVDAVIGLSRSLGALTVAEGVENPRDVEVLRQLGCGLSQGYLFGRPVPRDQVLAVAAQARDAATETAATAAGPRGRPTADAAHEPALGASA